ncbi:FkbM family methyltransferase, partial [Desulfurivibrio sp. C05AmB]|uniref:FkbM family methyltransferase n=1 Tax=Desulfurivibrio sp. C05AmB TaxID=3374371 RepID=UPI00376ED692
NISAVYQTFAEFIDIDKDPKMDFSHSQLPPWLTNNRLFRLMFILRKLYLSRTTSKHYAQFGEDISIKRFFDKNHRGFFVDVGCFHPKKHNNTWLLYKKGWRGINIDIDPIKIMGFNIVRPGDTNITSAVSNKEGEISYYSSGFYSLTTSLDADFVRGKEGYTKKTTRCSTLNRILDDTKYKNKQIDLLSVDAEGHDLEVLMSLDFDRYDPKLIAVETHHTLLPQVEKSTLYTFLAGKGYCLAGWCGLTLLMASRSLQHELA